ncbi:MAG: hypothetical protein ACYCP0_03270 [Acidiferrobacteraceae bacterium]
MSNASRRLTDYTLPELKRVYVTLHAALEQDPALMDSELLQDLQQLLQRRADEAQVDATDHAAWDRWLHASSHTPGHP